MGEEEGESTSVYLLRVCSSEYDKNHNVVLEIGLIHKM